MLESAIKSYLQSREKTNALVKRRHKWKPLHTITPSVTLRTNRIYRGPKRAMKASTKQITPATQSCHLSSQMKRKQISSKTRWRNCLSWLGGDRVKYTHGIWTHPRLVLENRSYKPVIPQANKPLCQFMQLPAKQIKCARKVDEKRKPSSSYGRKCKGNTVILRRASIRTYSRQANTSRHLAHSRMTSVKCKTRHLVTTCHQYSQKKNK